VSGSLLEALSPVAWPTLVLVTARVVGLMLIAPLWSNQSVPAKVRGAIVVLLSLMLLPAVPADEVPGDVMLLPLPIAVEILVGLAIGLCGAVIQWGVALGAEVASLQMGLNLGPSMSPMADSAPSGLGELTTMLALALYVTLGGHLMLLQGVAQSFHVIRPGGAVDFAGGSQALIALVGTVFSAGVRVAAPLIVALLLANAALGVINKAVPQLNAMTIAFPVTIGVGLVVFGASLPYAGAFIGRSVQALPQQAARVVDAMAAGGARP